MPPLSVYSCTNLVSTLYRQMDNRGLLIDPSTEELGLKPDRGLHLTQLAARLEIPVFSATIAEQTSR